MSGATLNSISLLKNFWTHRQGELGLLMHLGTSCGHESLWAVFPFPVSTMVSERHFVLFKYSRFVWESRFISSSLLH